MTPPFPLPLGMFKNFNLKFCQNSRFLRTKTHILGSLGTRDPPPQKIKLAQPEHPLAAVHALQPRSLPHVNDQIWNVSIGGDPRLHMSELVSGECAL